MTRPDRRSRTLQLSAVGVALAILLAACSSAATPAPTPLPTAAVTAAPAATPVKGLVNLGQDAKLGGYLTGADGKSLYLFTKDAKDKSTASAGVIANWPPLLATGSDAPTAGSGVTGTLTTIKRDDGTTQVTYNGIPLYYYVKDAKAGDFGGQGLNGVWFLVPVAATASSGAPKGGIAQDAAASPAASAAASPAAKATGGSLTTTAVSIAKFVFPATTTISVGMTVNWTNNDPAPHTVTAKDGSFDSKDMNQGQAFERTFTAAGSYAYVCTIHSDMAGTILVQEVTAY